MWNYAELSKTANKYGGPEKYIEVIKNSSFHEGELKMFPWIVVAAAGSSFVTAFIIKGINYFKEFKNFEEQNATINAKELIDGINEYNATQYSNENKNFKEEN